MSNFRLIAQGADVSAACAEVDAQPELWGQNGYRTNDPSSPHRDVPDIWLRWRAAAELTSPQAFAEPHLSTFWPAWWALPALHPLVYNLSAAMRSVQLGGILITRTPPGGRVKPHTDHGWHPEHYNTKLYLVLRSNPFCINRCGGDAENFRAGDVWQYPNDIEHSVTNDGPTDHVNVIICLRTELAP